MAHHPAPSGATAAEFAEKQFGRPTMLQESRPSVGTTPTRIIQNNPRRLFWYATNRGTSDGSVGFDQTVTATTGIPVPQGGGYVSMHVSEDGEPVAWEAWAVCGVAAQAWYVLEIIAV